MSSQTNRNKKKVVVYFPRPFSDTRPWRGTPLALLAISKILAQEGYDIKIIADFLHEDHMAEVLCQCEDSLCVGITCMTGFQIHDGLRIARLVRSSFPQLPIIWGGWHPSILPEETMRDENVDIVVQGQGERKFAEIVHRLADGSSLGDIPGVGYKSGETIVINHNCPIEDVNNFPPFPYHLVDIEKCLATTEYGTRTIQYVSSYGCPHRCGFCIEPIVNRRRWTGLAGERVVSEWEYLYKHYGIDSVAVYDSNFFVDKHRVHDICDGLLKKNIKIKWGNANGRIPQLVKYEPEIWELMQRSGCQMILTGAESGSQEALEFVHKDMEVEQTREFTELCHKYGIRILYSYLVGLPWSADPKENERRVEEEYDFTLKQIDSLLKIDPRNRFMFYLYTPYPGGEMYDRALELGFQPPETLDEWSRFQMSPEDAFNTVVRQKWISKGQARRAAMLTQYVFGMMDIEARDRIAARMHNPIFRILFLLSWNTGLLLARLRWRFKFWSLPVDFWIYTQVRKYLKLI